MPFRLLLPAIVLVLGSSFGCASPIKKVLQMQATAYSVAGKTESGVRAREGIVAADPSVLPLGSRIKVRGENGYLGEFVVADTGQAVQGRHIDLYLASDAAAKRFGTQTVTVEVLSWGQGAAQARQEVRTHMPKGPTPAAKQ